MTYSYTELFLIGFSGMAVYFYIGFLTWGCLTIIDKFRYKHNKKKHMVVVKSITLFILIPIFLLLTICNYFGIWVMLSVVVTVEIILLVLYLIKVFILKN